MGGVVHKLTSALASAPTMNNHAEASEEQKPGAQKWSTNGSSPACLSGLLRESEKIRIVSNDRGKTEWLLRAANQVGAIHPVFYRQGDRCTEKLCNLLNNTEQRSDNRLEWSPGRGVSPNDAVSPGGRAAQNPPNKGTSPLPYMGSMPLLRFIYYFSLSPFLEKLK